MIEIIGEKVSYYSLDKFHRSLINDAIIEICKENADNTEFAVMYEKIQKNYSYIKKIAKNIIITKTDDGSYNIYL